MYVTVYFFNETGNRLLIRRAREIIVRSTAKRLDKRQTPCSTEHDHSWSCFCCKWVSGWR